MKTGDIFYFVDVALGKVSKHKVKIVPPSTLKQYESVKFSNLSYTTILSNVFINPSPENYFTSNTKFYGTNKCYLVFTEAELAQRALVDYVLPKKAEKIKEESDRIIAQYHTIVAKSEAVEIELKNNTENFDKKCNALKKKFV